MAIYAVGDVQGCALRLEELLEKIDFDPARDTLWLTGDLVNRGPHSLETIQLVRSLGASAVTVLGNHDLHFLAVAAGVRGTRAGDTLGPLIRSPDFDEIVFWMRHLPLMHCDRSLKTLMVHAGTYPGWKRKQALGHASEVEAVLRSDRYARLLKNMYGEKPKIWHPDLKGWLRLRFILNAFTRMRFCDLKGNLDFLHKGPPGTQPRRLVPWFEHDGLKCGSWRIVFGHWSAAGYLQKGRIISLDSGCVWGGSLTAVRLDDRYIAPSWHCPCMHGIR